MSDRRQFLTTTIGTLILTIGLCLGYEALARSRNYPPHVSENLHLWRHWYQKSLHPNSVAFVGDSRAHTAYDLATARQLLPNRIPCMLAKDSSDPFVVLERLAEDSRFGGIAIVQIAMDRIDPPNRLPLRNFVAEMERNFTPADYANDVMRAALQDRFAMLNPNCAPIPYAKAAISMRSLPPWDGQFRGYFSREIEVRLPEEIAQRQLAEFRTRVYAQPDPKGIEDWTQRIQAWIQQIEGRGGSVAVVFHPCDSSADQVYPRDQFWDKFADHLGVPSFHYTDDPRTAGMTTVDGLHIASDDRQLLTRAMLESLRKQGLKL
ncbi:MAG: hypothetical protein AAF585_03735 [Verrucomicrobiota bacterium]